MSDVFRFSVMSDVRARVRAVLRGATEADMDAFEILLARDCMVTDDGQPHPELVAWVQRILDQGAGDAIAIPIVPKPVTGPAGAMVPA